jgi:osmotically-inducible protein OsmY
LIRIKAATGEGRRLSAWTLHWRPLNRAIEEYAMNDKELRQDVIDELEFDPSIDAANIGVAAEKGVVTLTGHVASYAEKLAAEQATWRVTGVKGIAQEIQVRIPSDKKTNDDEIAQRAIRVLEWSVPAPAGAIHVKVQGGYVTLSGSVEWNFQRLAAERAVRTLTGVAGVSNQVMLAPRASVVDVEDRIRAALKRHADVEAARIRISIQDGRVELRGEVDDWDERLAVENAAWSVPGVRAVEDNLRVI